MFTVRDVNLLILFIYCFYFLFFLSHSLKSTIGYLPVLFILFKNYLSSIFMLSNFFFLDRVRSLSVFTEMYFYV